MLATLADTLWNPWLLGFFLLTGLYLSLRSGFFPLFCLPTWVKATICSLFTKKHTTHTGISSIQALSTALAATIGTGSIAGVATAIVLGGAGSLFWMWVAALLGMMTSCVEKLLAVRFHRPTQTGSWRGGPMYYLLDGLGCPVLAVWFALACLPATLAGGNLVQSASIASALEHSLGIPKLATGLLLACTVACILKGGLAKIATLSSLLVPSMALLYLGSGCIILFVCRDMIPDAFHLIVSSAFSPPAALGGGMGYSILTGLRYGVARGVFTNEAGLGASAIAHAAAQVEHPARQGMWGIFEVFVSTFLVCTLTGLVILVSGVYQPTEVLVQIQSGTLPESALGVPLVSTAFSTVFGSIGSWIVSLCLLLFAFSSILGWSYYGQEALYFLSPSVLLQKGYSILFLVCIVAGAVWDVSQLWSLVDVCNALMAIPNLIGLLALSPQAFRCLDSWLTIRKSNW